MTTDIYFIQALVCLVYLHSTFDKSNNNNNIKDIKINVTRTLVKDL